MTWAVCFGEVLWDMLPNGAVPGGAPMNVAFHLNQLGKKALMISKVGTDEKGYELIDFMNNNQVPADLIQQDDNYSTSVVLATPGQNQEVKYDIVKPVAWDFIDSTVEARQAASQADYFIFGSLAARTEHSLRTLFDLLSVAKSKILDINLRAPHYKQADLENLLRQADILKMNEIELDEISEWYADISLFNDKVRMICDRYAIPQIIVTKGAAGASYFDGEKFYEHPGFKVKVADTVGSGDAFLAGFLHKVTDNYTSEETLEFACKLGAYVASKKGACPIYKIEEIL